MLYIGDNGIKIFRFEKGGVYHRLLLDNFGFLVQAHRGLEEADLMEIADVLKTVDKELFRELTENLNPLDPLYKELRAKTEN